MKFMFVYLLLLSPLSTVVTTAKEPDTFKQLLSESGYPKPGDIPVLNRKVFRGRRVNIKEHPYIVSIRRNFAHYLTGTLITKNLVITIAHAVYGVPIMELGVVVSENYADRGSSMNTVVLIVIHENFNEYTLQGDIALLRVYENIVFKGSVKPIQLISHHTQLHGSRAFVTGWGRCDNTGTEICLPRSTRYNRDEILDPMLRTISFIISIPNYYCEAYEQNRVKIEPGMMCVGVAREEDLVCPCLGVPGAPMVISGRLAGIASWGFGCGYSYDLPLVYTKITHYSSWILTNIIIQRRIDQSNLSTLFIGTKATLLKNWFEKTRIITPVVNREPVNPMSALHVDKLLAYLPGTVYDIRDFIYNGTFKQEKNNLYENYKKRISDIKKWKLKRPKTRPPRPFLSGKF